MEQIRYFWEFKDRELTLSDLDRFIGSTVRQIAEGSILRVICRRATKDAIRAAGQENARGKIKIVIEMDEG
jgi:hypothetical protein